MHSEDPRREAFWSYGDLVVLLLLVIPAILAGFAVMAIAARYFPLGEMNSGPRLLGAQFAFYLFWFAALWLLLHTRYRQPFWRSLGWRRTRGRDLLLSAVVGPILAIALAMLAVALETPKFDSPIEKLITGRQSLLIVAAVATTIGPLCEELMFRGFMMPLFARTFGVLAAIVLTALPFALLHGPQYGWHWQIIVLLAAAGFAFGWVRYQTGSLIPAFLMHATYNFTQFLGYALNKDFI